MKARDTLGFTELLRPVPEPIPEELLGSFSQTFLFFSSVFGLPYGLFFGAGVSHIPCPLVGCELFEGQGSCLISVHTLYTVGT